MGDVNPSKDKAVDKILRIFFYLIIFLTQLVIIPNFLNSSNEAKFLFFCFFSFLLLVFFPPKNISFYFVDIPLITTVVFFVTSTFHSSYRAHAFIPLLVLSLIVCYRLYVGRFFEHGSDTATIFLRVFIVFVLIMAILGLYEYIDFILFGRCDEPLIPYLLPANVSKRIGGIFGQPNFMALFFLVGILVYFYSHLHDLAFSSNRFRWLHYFPFLIISFAFFLTGSRAGFLALTLVVLFLCLLITRKAYLLGDAHKKKDFYILLSVLVGAYLITFSLNTIFFQQGARELTGVGTSVEARFVFWTAAVQMFIDHPWLGVGLDNFKFLLPNYLISAHDYLGFVQYEAMGYTSWVHNEFLQLVSEGGVVVLVSLSLMLLCLFYPLFKFFMGSCQWSPLKLYSHLFVVPFVIQSMFSWPLRHAGLLVFFLTFCGLLLSQYRGCLMRLSVSWQSAIRCFALCGLVITLFVVSKEVNMGTLAIRVKQIKVQESFGDFERLVLKPYSEYPLLLKIIPYYAQAAVRSKDNDFANSIIPYLQRLTEIQGAHWQWFFLSKVYHRLDRNEDAMSSITRAIELRPTEQVYWGFQHYLNMLKASNETGRPLEDFLPIPPGGTIEDLEGLFDFNDRIKVNI